MHIIYKNKDIEQLNIRPKINKTPRRKLKEKNNLLNIALAMMLLDVTLTEQQKHKTKHTGPHQSSTVPHSRGNKQLSDRA